MSCQMKYYQYIYHTPKWYPKQTEIPNGVHVAQHWCVIMCQPLVTVTGREAIAPPALKSIVSILHQKMDSWKWLKMKMDTPLRGWEFTFSWGQPIRKEVKDMVQYCRCNIAPWGLDVDYVDYVAWTWRRAILHLRSMQYCNIATKTRCNIAPIQYRSP